MVRMANILVAQQINADLLRIIDGVKEISDYPFRLVHTLERKTALIFLLREYSDQNSLAIFLAYYPPLRLSSNMSTGI